MEEAEFRVAHCRAGLRAASELPQGAVIRAEVGPEALHAIEDTFRLAWLPMQHHMALIEAIRRHIGDEGCYQLWRRVSTASYDWPVIKIPFDGIRRLFGLTPATLASQAARFWPHFARGVGNFRYADAGPGSGVLTLEGCPPEYLRSGTLALGLAGGFSSYFDMCNVEGRITPHVADLTLGVVDFDLRWTTPR